MSKPYSAASIREVFSCILKYPDFGSRKLAEKTGVSRSSIDRFRIQARELDLTADMISSMTDEEINTLFNREAKRDDANFSYVACWKYNGEGNTPELIKEDLNYQFVKVQTRNYKS